MSSTLCTDPCTKPSPQHSQQLPHTVPSSAATQQVTRGLPQLLVGTQLLSCHSGSSTDLIKMRFHLPSTCQNEMLILICYAFDHPVVFLPRETSPRADSAWRAPTSPAPQQLHGKYRINHWKKNHLIFKKLMMRQKPTTRALRANCCLLCVPQSSSRALQREVLGWGFAAGSAVYPQLPVTDPGFQVLEKKKREEKSLVLVITKSTNYHPQMEKDEGSPGPRLSNRECDFPGR